jgi:hypothetical protein
LTHLERGDDNVRWVDSDGDGGSVRLLNGHSLDVDDPFLSVDLDDLSLSSLVFASDDEDLVVLSDGQRSGLKVVSE